MNPYDLEHLIRAFFPSQLKPSALLVAMRHELGQPVPIAQALLLTEETVRKHIRAYVADGYGLSESQQGIHNWLDRNGFS